MKRRIAKILCLLMIAASVQCTAFAKNGDIVGYTEYSDIAAYINHYAITSYNINGYTAVVAEDLRNYGFNVEWNGAERSLKITRNLAADKITPYGTVYKYSSKIGQNAFPYLETDIVTYVNGQKVESFNINGNTCIYLESLCPYGKVVWVPEVRALKMWIDGLPMNNYAALPEASSQQTAVIQSNSLNNENITTVKYSAPQSYYTLKQYLMTKGDYINGSYTSTAIRQSGTTTFMMYNPADEYVAFSFGRVLSDGSQMHVQLIIYENEVPGVICSMPDLKGNEMDVLIGQYRTPDITVLYSEFESLTDSYIKTVNSVYKLFDSFLNINRIDVKISDFGIDY